MKNIKSENLKEPFTPVKIEFVIETEEELLALWHRLNVSSVYLMDYFQKNSYRKAPFLPLRDLWEEIENIRSERDINLYDSKEKRGN